MQFRLFAALLLALTIGLKLCGDHAVPEENWPSAMRQTSRNYAAAGYDVSAEPGRFFWINIARGECRLTLRLLDPHATRGADVARDLAPIGRITYIWRGKWRDRLPRAGPLLEYYFQRELARQNLAASRRPVWIAAVGKRCRDRPDPRLSDVPVTLVPPA